MKMNKKNNKGITLVEVIVSIVLLSLVATPLLGAFSYGLKMERRSLVHALATYTAQMKMEEAYGMDEDELLSNYMDEDIEKVGNLAAEGLPELDFIYKAEPYTPTLDSGNLLNDTDYAGFNLYTVTVTIKNNFYGVEVTLEDVFYAKPSTP